MSPLNHLQELKYPTKPSLSNLTSPDWGQPNAEHNPALESLGDPHVQSFNFMLNEGMKLAVDDLRPTEFQLPDSGVRVKILVTECNIHPPHVPPGSMNVNEPRVFPTEARQRGVSYKGRCQIKYSYWINDVLQPSQEKVLGNLPIMLKSEACNLNGLSPKVRALIMGLTFIVLTKFSAH